MHPLNRCSFLKIPTHALSAFPRSRDQSVCNYLVLMFSAGHAWRIFGNYASQKATSGEFNAQTLLA